MDHASPDARWGIYARELGLSLQRARHQAGLSQEKVANAAGISAYTYRKLEHGQSNPGSHANPRLRTLAALAEVLGIEITDLLPPVPGGIADGRASAEE
jgi:transcriptional regulator with XRE-family HTH domain